MIYPQDVRIGNYLIVNNIQFASGNKELEWKYRYVKVTGCFEDKIFYNRDNSRRQDDCRYFAPIPLTPELLENCGFKPSSDVFGGWLSSEFDNSRIRLRSSDTFFTWSISENGPNVKLKYLHELQNLYFALTGEELSVNIQLQTH